MRILVVNDDGIRAEGLAALVRVASEHGEVRIATPDRERSCCGHGMTMHDPLRARENTLLGHPAWEVDGLPVDCVNVGLTYLWPDGCDLLLSGINHGPNLGFDTTYSGTVAGAMEGAINGVKSIAVSMALFVSDAPLHIETGESWLRENIGLLLSLPDRPLGFLNVNVPSIALPELQGHMVVATGQRVYKDRVEVRHDPWNRPYYWQGGAVVMDPDQEGTDVYAVSRGYVSITALTLDWTDHAFQSEVDRVMKS
jgi:5'-nucleotidase